jgi:hypothetical protein
VVRAVKKLATDATSLVIGTDYDRLGQMYVDNESGESFAEPETDCVCLACGFVSDPEHLATRNIYAYTIS